MLKSGLNKLPSPHTLFSLTLRWNGWMTNRLIAKVCKEIETGEISLFNTHPLLKVQAKVSLIDTEIHFILKPNKNRLLNSLRGKSNVENKLNQLLSQWQTQYPHTPGYTASNVRNLLGQLNAVEV